MSQYSDSSFRTRWHLFHYPRLGGCSTQGGCVKQVSIFSFKLEEYKRKLAETARCWIFSFSVSQNRKQETERRAKAKEQIERKAESKGKKERRKREKGKDQGERGRRVQERGAQTQARERETVRQNDRQADRNWGEKTKQNERRKEQKLVRQRGKTMGNKQEQEKKSSPTSFQLRLGFSALHLTMSPCCRSCRE